MRIRLSNDDLVVIKDDVEAVLEWFRTATPDSIGTFYPTGWGRTKSIHIQKQHMLYIEVDS